MGRRQIYTMGQNAHSVGLKLFRSVADRLDNLDEVGGIDPLLQIGVVADDAVILAQLTTPRPSNRSACRRTVRREMPVIRAISLIETGGFC